MEKVNILFNTVDSEATGMHRMLMPLEVLRNQGYQIEALNKQILTEQIERNDVIFLQCLIGAQQFSLMEKLKQDGIKIIIDYDDDFSNLPKPILKKLKLTSSEAENNWKNYLDFADKIIVPTEMLKKRISALSKVRVEVIPNYISKQEYENSLDYVNDDLSEIRIIYSCSDSHLEDYQYISGILNLAGKMYPSIKLISHGGISLDKFIDNYSYKHQHIPAVPYYSYYKALREIKPHIFIAPLKVTPHNVCRSNLKYLQAGLLKAAFIGENLAPYEQVRKNKTGLTCTTRIGWWWNLRTLIKNPNLITEFGNKSFLDVKNHILEDHISKWKHALSDF